jgi:signal peptidase
MRPSAVVRFGRGVGAALVVVLLLAAVLPFVVYAAPVLVGADESYVVLSSSMEPAIAVGDVVVVAAVDTATVAPGDVITFGRAGESIPVTHRVVSVAGPPADRVFTTKGDANADTDRRQVPASEVLGRVVVTLPFIGHVIQFANTTSGFLALVVAPIALLLVTEASQFVRSPGPPGNEGESGGTAASVHDGTGGRPPERSAAPSTSGEVTNSDGGSATFTVTPTDLAMTTAVLVAATLYAGYVAWALRSPLSVSVAVAFAGGALFVGGTRLIRRPGVPTRSGRGGGANPPESESATDGGSGLERER